MYLTIFFNNLTDRLLSEQKQSTNNPKSEQELFDETIDSNAETPEIASSLETAQPQPNTIRDTVNSNHRRIMKRRYKSGIPLNNDRNEEDSIEEIYLKNFSDNLSNKTSKDDSDISLASSLCCPGANNERNYKDCLYHSTSDKLLLSGIEMNGKEQLGNNGKTHRHQHNRHNYHNRQQSNGNGQKHVSEVDTKNKEDKRVNALLNLFLLLF